MVQVQVFGKLLDSVTHWDAFISRIHGIPPEAFSTGYMQNPTRCIPDRSEEILGAVASECSDICESAQEKIVKFAKNQSVPRTYYYYRTSYIRSLWRIISLPLSCLAVLALGRGNCY